MQKEVIVVTVTRMTLNGVGDSCLLTEKKHLPVKQLRFGDVDVHNGFHEVG